ncbi:MAG: DUF1549 domain-containing protein, partial [Bryobacteraceae bacterium]
MRKQSIAAASVAAAGVFLYGPGPALRAQNKIDFLRDIQPVLEKSCYGCHSAANQMGALRLDSKSAAAKSIAPGKAAESKLYQRVAGAGDAPRMPMGAKPLDAEVIAKIKQWIDEGAEWPDGAIGRPAETKKHWSYAAPQRPALPAVSKPAWPRNAIDHFILARLDKEGLAPSPEADRVTLLRRLSLDLIGLPPTPAEVDAFLADKSPNAYENQVDRLLRSPHFGERQARHWLDNARYADSDGFEKDKQ